MIYLKAGTDLQKVEIPKIRGELFETLILKFKGTVSLRTFEFIVENTGQSRDYYTFELEIGDMPEGEYTYLLTDGDKIYKTGIAQVEAVSPEAKIYEKRIEYKQYEQNQN